MPDWGGVLVQAGWIAVLIQAASSLLTAIVVVCLPSGCLLPLERAPSGRWWSPRNLLAFLLLGLGVVLSLPILPGPGTLCLMIGFLLLDVPAKNRLQRRLLAKPRVAAVFNWIRARVGRAPLRFPESV